MSKQITIGLVVSLLVAGGALAQATPAAGTESAASRLAAQKADPAQAAANIESVGKLLATSSAARQIESSKVPEALQRHARARDLHREAKAALDQGNAEKAAGLLSEARSTFFDAVRLAAPEEVSAKKNENDYLLRVESVQALLGAYKRISDEKAAKGVADTVAQIDRSLAAGAALAKERKFKEARTEVDRGYLVAKAGLTNLRSGDTLVRSLNFANKEEEFHYELDRNNTHQMLIKVLVDEKKASDEMIKSFLNKGQALRVQADQAAASKSWGEAVRLLEEATTELMRAIRNAGIYIPG
jgi:hypothetical protein